MQLTVPGEALLNKVTAALTAIDGIGLKANQLQKQVQGKIHLALNTDPEILCVEHLIGKV